MSRKKVIRIEYPFLKEGYDEWLYLERIIEEEVEIQDSKVNYPGFKPDSVVDAILNKFVDRAEKGFVKYNNTLDRKDLSKLDWINHAQDELMDGILYLERLKQEILNEQESTSNSQTDSEA